MQRNHKEIQEAFISIPSPDNPAVCVEKWNFRFISQLLLHLASSFRVLISVSLLTPESEHGGNSDFEIIQGDQNVSVHLMITVQKHAIPILLMI
jgi:hypothetical protein